MTDFRIVDLFAGIGGLRQGVTQSIANAGKTSSVVFTSEIKKEAIQTLEVNFPQHSITGDIQQVKEQDIPAHDILLAGFPCQAFSYAGKREGFNDATRGTLFFDVARILAHHKPQYFILENVEGLITHDPDPVTKEGRTLAVILSTLEELGYTVTWGSLNATDYGVPQARKRVFITGSLSNASTAASGELDAQLTKHPSQPLSSILETGVDETDAKLNDFSQLLKETYPDLTAIEGKIFRDWRGGARNIHSWNINYKGETTPEERSLLESLMMESKRSHWADRGLERKGEGFPLTVVQIAQSLMLKQSEVVSMLARLTTMGYVGQVGDTYRITSGRLSLPASHVVSKDAYVNTLTATDADRLCIIDNGNLRRFTDLEVKRLFGFSDDYAIPAHLSRSKMFDLFGNSVVIPVVRALADWLLRE